jgi:hypothetical protein
VPGKLRSRNKKFWEELIAYLPLRWHGPYRNKILGRYTGTQTARCLATIRETHWQQSDLISLKNDGGGTQARRWPHNTHKKFWEEIIAYFPLIRQGRHSKSKN